MARSIKDLEKMEEKEVKKLARAAEQFIKSAERRLMSFGKTLLEKKREIPIKIGIGDISYTNGEQIVATIYPVEALLFSREEMMSALKVKISHETQHVHSTVMDEYVNCINRIHEFWLKEANKQGIIVNQMTLRTMASNICNSIEDGRIEKILLCKREGLKPLYKWYRMLEWNETCIQKKCECGKESIEIICNLHRIATLGIYQKNFKKIYKKGDVVFDKTMELKSLVLKAVRSYSCKECMDCCFDIAKGLTPMVLETAKMSQLDMELFDLIKKLAEKIRNEEKSFVAKKKSEEYNDSPEAGELIDLYHKKSSARSEDTEDLKNPKSSRNDDNSDDTSNNSEESKNTECLESTYKEDKNCDEGIEGDGQSKKTENTENFNNSQDSKNGNTDNLVDTAKDYEKEDENDFEEGMTEEEIEKEMEQFSKEMKNISKNDIKAIDKEEKREESLQSVEDFSKSLDSSLYEEEYVNGFEEKKREEYSNEQLDTLTKRYGNVFARSVDIEMKNKSTPDIRNITSGRFDKRNISKLAYGSPNIMMKSGQPSMFDGCVYVLKDGSGSMFGSKQFDACTALAIIEQGLKGKVPLKMTEFFTRSKVTHNVIKDWNDNKKDYNYAWSYYKHTSPRGGNKDGYSIRIAAKELLQRAESQKLLIIGSDGLPSDYNNNNNAYLDVQLAVSEARKNGIFVCSIYFGEAEFIESNRANYESMYEKDFIGCSPDRLPKELIKIIKKFIKAY